VGIGGDDNSNCLREEKISWERRTCSFGEGWGEKQKKKLLLEPKPPVPGQSGGSERVADFDAAVITKKGGVFHKRYQREVKKRAIFMEASEGCFGPARETEEI